MGLKRLHPGVWTRVRSGWKEGIAGGAAAIGFIGTALAFTGAADLHFTPQLLAITVSPFVLVVGLIAAYVGGRSKLLPDSFVDEIGDERHFHAHLCTADGLREACDLTRASYGSAYVRDVIAEQWRIRNPFAFVQIMNPENRLCACFGVLALRQSFMDQFIAGLVSDQQLRGENVCGWPESKASSQLYLSGVVVLEPSSHKGHKRAAVMFWAMLEYIRRLYGLKTPRRLYAVAVTPETSRLMRNLGFVVETAAAHRTDNCDLYRYDLTEASWNVLLCELNDWSRMCTVDLALPEHGDSLSIEPSPSPGSSSAQRLALKTIVFVAGDRGGSQRNLVQIPRELTSIQAALRGSKNRDAFHLAQPILAATRQALAEVCRERPVILHFAGHGDDRSLSFILDQGPVVSATRMIAQQLATILGSFPDRVQLCVLNTCESASIAKHLVDAHVVDAAIGWPGKVTDTAAITFSGTLYGCLGEGLAVSQSVTLAAQSCDSEETPIIYTDEGINPDVYTFTERTAE